MRRITIRRRPHMFLVVPPGGGSPLLQVDGKRLFPHERVPGSRQTARVVVRTAVAGWRRWTAKWRAAMEFTTKM